MVKSSKKAKKNVKSKTKKKTKTSKIQSTKYEPEVYNDLHSSLSDSIFKDSFDKLLGDRNDRRKKLNLKEHVRASFNRDSSFESSSENEGLFAEPLSQVNIRPSFSCDSSFKTSPVSDTPEKQLMKNGSALNSNINFESHSTNSEAFDLSTQLPTPRRLTVCSTPIVKSIVGLQKSRIHTLGLSSELKAPELYSPDMFASYEGFESNLSGSNTEHKSRSNKRKNETPFERKHFSKDSLFDRVAKRRNRKTLLQTATVENEIDGTKGSPGEGSDKVSFGMSVNKQTQNCRRSMTAMPYNKLMYSDSNRSRSNVELTSNSVDDSVEGSHESTYSLQRNNKLRYTTGSLTSSASNDSSKFSTDVPRKDFSSFTPNERSKNEQILLVGNDDEEHTRVSQSCIEISSELSSNVSNELYENLLIKCEAQDRSSTYDNCTDMSSKSQKSYADENTSSAPLSQNNGVLKLPQRLLEKLRAINDRSSSHRHTSAKYLSATQDNLSGYIDDLRKENEDTTRFSSFENSVTSSVMSSRIQSSKDAISATQESISATSQQSVTQYNLSSSDSQKEHEESGRLLSFENAVRSSSAMSSRIQSSKDKISATKGSSISMPREIQHNSSSYITDSEKDNGDTTRFSSFEISIPSSSSAMSSRIHNSKENISTIQEPTSANNSSVFSRHSNQSSLENSQFKTKSNEEPLPTNGRKTRNSGSKDTAINSTSEIISQESSSIILKLSDEDYSANCRTTVDYSKAPQSSSDESDDNLMEIINSTSADHAPKRTGSEREHLVNKPKPLVNPSPFISSRRQQMIFDLRELISNATETNNSTVMNDNRNGRFDSVENSSTVVHSGVTPTNYVNNKKTETAPRNSTNKETEVESIPASPISWKKPRTIRRNISNNFKRGTLAAIEEGKAICQFESLRQSSKGIENNDQNFRNVSTLVGPRECLTNISNRINCINVTKRRHKTVTLDLPAILESSDVGLPECESLQDCNLSKIGELEADTFLNSISLHSGKWRRQISSHRRRSFSMKSAFLLEQIDVESINNLKVSLSNESNRQALRHSVSLNLSRDNFADFNDTSERRAARRRRTSVVNPSVDVDRFTEFDFGTIYQARDTILRKCGQSEPLEFADIYSEGALRQCRKIGEGVYGEVFMNKTDAGRAIVLKIIPIEGTLEVNGEPQKKFDEVLSEIVIAQQLSSLRNDKEYMTSSFAEVIQVRCVQGRYPNHLIDLWELYRDNYQTENDHPEVFNDDQLYIVFELGNGGQDLEAFQFANALQSKSAFQQTALALAIAEKKLQFEHRDLHWGNILLSPTDEKFVNFKLNGTTFQVPSEGIKVTIIDYTLSRMLYDGIVLYNDLSNDEELFTAHGDYQFDIYRLMKNNLENDWQRFQPFNNVLWLHYIIDKLINGARYKNTKSRKHRLAIEDLMVIRDEITNYKSAADSVSNA